MKRNLFDSETNSYFNFDSKTWDEVGSDGTGRLGHFSQQGDRTIYASPRKTKLGRHRFVISGTGYYSVPASGCTGSWDWGNETHFLPYESALEKMEEYNREAYLQKNFDFDFYKNANVENTVPRGGRGTESILEDYPELIRVRYYKNGDETRKTVEIEI